ncbi:MAG: hypothetical protein AAFX02_03060 [Pseudomonadota bacterium]
MFRLLLSAVLAFLLSTAAMAQKSVPLDRVVDVELDEKGEAKLSVRLPKAGVIKALVFSGVEPVFTLDESAVDATETDTAIAPLPVSAVALERGTHPITASLPDAPNGTFQVRFVHEPALDRFEPNNTPDDAIEVSTPFAGIVRFGSNDPDWFEIDAPAGHLIGVQLLTNSSYVGPVIGFYDLDGEVIYQSPRTQWGHRGMRYIVSPGGKTRIQLSDTARLETNAGYLPLVIKVFPPMAESNSVLVKLDMGANEDTAFQLDALGRSVGARLAAADDAETIAAELNRAVTEKRRSGSPWLWIILASVAVLAFGGFTWRRRSARPAPAGDAGDTTPDQNAEV